MSNLGDKSHYDGAGHNYSVRHRPHWSFVAKRSNAHESSSGFVGMVLEQLSTILRIGFETIDPVY